MKIMLYFHYCRTQATPQSLWLKPSLAIMLKSAFAQELASAELGGRQCLVSAVTALKEGSEDSITHRTTVQVTSVVITPPASFSSPIHDHISPRIDAVSPRRKAVSPRREAVPPRTDTVSPRLEAVSSRCEAVSPSADTVSLPHKLVLGLPSPPLAVVAPFQALNSTLIEIFPQSVSEISPPSFLTTNQSKQCQIKSKKHQLSSEKQQENPPPPPKHYQDAHVKPHHRQQRHRDEQPKLQHRDQQQQQHHRDQQQQQQHHDQQQQQQHRDQQQQQQHRDQQQQQQHRDQQQQQHRHQQQRSSSALRNDLDLSMRIFDEDIVRKDCGLVINFKKLYLIFYFTLKVEGK
jgi:hypothetical protein